MTEPSFVTTNFFIQAQRAAELAVEQHEELRVMAEKINAQGGIQVSIHYG